MANEQPKLYIITLHKDFLQTYLSVSGEYWFKINVTPDREWAINQARELNGKAAINLNLEQFQVWETDNKNGAHNKRSTCIYPSKTEPLF